ncbi:MAG: NAD(P)/FAD-dependent oxidoreductase [Cyanobacteria bacterium P01_A01_bin.135]
MSPKIVVVGAGFAGLSAVQPLARAKADVLLIDRNNYHTFVPLLYQVATGFVGPDAIAYPIRQALRPYRTARFLQGTVAQVDFAQRYLILEDAGELVSHDPVPYDYLVLATGSQTRFLRVPGAPRYTWPLRTLADAVALQQQVVRCVATAAAQPEWRSSQLTFVVVGGGPTGVEMAGALSEFVNESLMKDYPELGKIQARIFLIQSGDRLLAGLPPKLGNHAAAQLRRRGVKVHFNAKVASVTPKNVTLDDGLEIDTATVIWAAGVEANSPALSEAVQQEGSKLQATPTLQMHSHPNVYVIGDLSDVEQLDLDGVAPEAMQQGKAVAENIQRQVAGQGPRPFRYKDKGRAAIIARNTGVAYVRGFSITGVLGWLTWLGVHLYYLPGLGNRLAVLISWVRDYIKRDRAHRQRFQFWQQNDRL